MSSFLSPGNVYESVKSLSESHVSLSLTLASISDRYRFDRPENKELSLFRTTKLAGLRTGDFVEKQVFYKSKDGTRCVIVI